MDVISKNWYLEMEVRRVIIDWEYLTHNFKVNFNFEDDSPLEDTSLQIIKNKIFISEDSTIPTLLCSVPIYSTNVQEVLECYNVAGED
jgi:hypothetical protein